MLNLGAISSNLAREVYFEFQKSLAESVEFRETHPLIEVCEDAIKHIVIKKEEIKKFSPELVK